MPRLPIGDARCIYLSYFCLLLFHVYAFVLKLLQSILKVWKLTLEMESLKSEVEISGRRKKNLMNSNGRRKKVLTKTSKVEVLLLSMGHSCGERVSRQIGVLYNIASTLLRATDSDLPFL